MKKKKKIIKGLGTKSLLLTDSRLDYFQSPRRKDKSKNLEWLAGKD